MTILSLYQKNMQSKLATPQDTNSFVQQSCKNNAQILTINQHLSKLLHDYKQPLSVLRLLGDDLLDSYEYDEINEHYLTEYHSTLNRQIQRLNDMAEAIQATLYSFEHTHSYTLHDLFTDMLPLFQHLEITIIFHDNPHLIGDSYIMGILIFSLLEYIKHHNQNNSSLFIQELHITPQRLSFTLPTSPDESTLHTWHYYLKCYNQPLKTTKIPHLRLEIENSLILHFK